VRIEKTVCIAVQKNPTEIIVVFKKETKPQLFRRIKFSSYCNQNKGTHGSEGNKRGEGIKTSEKLILTECYLIIFQG